MFKSVGIAGDCPDYREPMGFTPYFPYTLLTHIMLGKYKRAVIGRLPLKRPPNARAAPGVAISSVIIISFNMARGLRPELMISHQLEMIGVIFQ